jgi:hypothetical protein
VSARPNTPTISTLPPLKCQTSPVFPLEKRKRAHATLSLPRPLLSLVSLSSFLFLPFSRRRVAKRFAEGRRDRHAGEEGSQPSFSASSPLSSTHIPPLRMITDGRRSSWPKWPPLPRLGGGRTALDGDAIKCAKILANLLGHRGGLIHVAAGVGHHRGKSAPLSATFFYLPPISKLVSAPCELAWASFPFFFFLVGQA